MKSELLPIDKKYRIEIDIQSEMGTRTRPGMVLVGGIDIRYVPRQQQKNHRV